MTEEDWKFWIHNGYVVIKNVISKEQARGDGGLPLGI